MSPRGNRISTTYKTRVATEKTCKERKGTLIGQLKDSCHIGCAIFRLMGSFSLDFRRFGMVDARFELTACLTGRPNCRGREQLLSA
jgi:hypothetical protein